MSYDPLAGASGEPYVIRYEFLFEDGERRIHEIRLNPLTLLDETPLPAVSADWTKLAYKQCSNCPLRAADTPSCPTAARLQTVVESFAHTISHDRALVRVTLPERVVSKEVAVTRGLASLLGVHMSTSGCPVLSRLRPMVRFHMPFATSFETVFRAVSTYLVGEYLRHRRGEKADLDLTGLLETYEAVGRVNREFGRRLSGAVVEDSNMNALVQLDLFAKELPASIDEELEQMRYLFDASVGAATPPA